LSFVNAQRTAAHFLAVEVLNHRAQGLVIDFNEAEATRASRIAGFFEGTSNITMMIELTSGWTKRRQAIDKLSR
jgi:hypothetical protein